RPADAIGFVTACVLLVTTKAQHCFLGLPLALFILVTAGGIWAGNLRKFKAAAVTAILGGTLFSILAVPPEYDVAPLYTIIFTGILRTSNDVKGDLAALGLDESYTRWVDTTGFTIGNPLSNPDTLKQFTSKTSYLRVLRFFLTHPAKTYEVLVAAMGEAGRQRPQLGNFDRSAGRPEWAETTSFSAWSDWKKD